ncbi:MULTISPECIES: TlpA disulfide reductase family protein [Burkholderia]|uniref:TlpA family protein disulfide reductase n=1 Tax=Burkholderia humptydooensis TaxID=430531 RepID=A0A7U4PAT8_9BURK|nr:MULTISPECIES: TlpA disulfide reductase family protein [Burkholderia]AGK50702.1 redoxin family protein [Burkholderia thailandensis MSMB121]ATF33125.1 TlpA family protein disulfide reductase [Burkholderia thailandensis]AJY40541.1 redoxin family protein [Burkholderia sp. 2002721687]ALX46144.1 thiol:disulfide interchange protein [Burkholderia humptydooensis]KST70699.1 thiol:disulfide interchange protein [Burkholderia humptydooensis]
MHSDVEESPFAKRGWSRRDWLRGAGGVALGASLGGWLPMAQANSLAVGRPAPGLVLHTLDGQNIASDDLRGNVVILTFWATWCEPCRIELPLLSEYAAHHAANGLRVLGFSLDGPDSLAAVQQVAAKLSFPVGLLGSAYAGGYGRMWRIPVSFTIDRNGLLADNGWDDPKPSWTADRLERVVTPLLHG